MRDPHPGQGAHGDLERARPVDATHVGICHPPAFQLALDLTNEVLPAGHASRLRQDDEMLMAIELPDDLVVADAARVEEGNGPRICGPAGDVPRVVAAPIDVRAGVDLQAENG